MQITTFGKLDKRAYNQLVRCAEAGNAPYAVLCADHHVGYSQPIGGAIGYVQYISPSGVGYDIGCGNKAVMTNIRADDIDVAAVMDEIARRISFGIGRVNNEPVEHPVLDHIAQADVAPQRKLLDLAAEQLGTVGSGNHYVDLFRDEAGRLWIGVHFGSRGFGHRTATGFLALAQGKAFDERAKEGEMDSPPVLFRVDSPMGQDYIAAMQLAGEYAYAGRDLVIEKVLEILGARAEKEVHNHHNFAWFERHFDTGLWVVRKGCTPAFSGQLSFVGATMGEPAVILEGVKSEQARAALFSTVHGAGRVMSRTQAAGRRRWKRGKDGKRRQVVIKPGVVDWARVRADLNQRGIELRGGGADEAPEAYKRLDEVLEYHADTIRVLHTLEPIGVAMAGEDVEDPYKD
jgi:tRNA-splicing ligase RtcB (3'-phosphate/5'-hydroxy nucleic acid ligase)